MSVPLLAARQAQPLVQLGIVKVCCSGAGARVVSCEVVSALFTHRVRMPHLQHAGNPFGLHDRRFRAWGSTRYGSWASCRMGIVRFSRGRRLRCHLIGAPYAIDGSSFMGCGRSSHSSPLLLCLPARYRRRGASRPNRRRCETSAPGRGAPQRRNRAATAGETNMRGAQPSIAERSSRLRRSGSARISISTIFPWAIVKPMTENSRPSARRATKPSCSLTSTS